MLHSMPEGHTIHRYARLHREELGGRQVEASSPQGRFTEGASILDGRVLDDVEAVGKHLLYRFEGAPALHVHLGLFGRFVTYATADDDVPDPTSGTRLRLRTDEGPDGSGDLRPAVEVRLAGPTACELLDTDDEQALRARLGPDPLDERAEAPAFAAALSRRRVPIGQALLDQRVIAGIGNVFRAEALFVEGIDPATRSQGLSADEVAALWDTLRRMLQEGERTGRIVTVEASERPGELATDDARYVYRREGLPCRRCQTPLVSWQLSGRRIYACPHCQPTRATA